VAQAETLYQSYLAARLERARKVLKLAQFDLSQRPNHLARMQQVREAQSAVTRLEAQLNEQTQRAYEAKQAAEEQSRRVADRDVATAADTSSDPVPAVSKEATPEFRAEQAKRAEQASTPAADGTREPAPFITREEFEVLRRPSRPDARGE
jgi:hypothetical protein